MRCPDMLPMPISAALHLPVGPEGLAAPLAPSHRGHPEMESEGHIRLSAGAASPCQIPDPVWSGCPPFLLSPPWRSLAPLQTSKLRP